MKGEGDCRTVTFILATIMGSKNKKIHLRDFKDVDCKFAYFEIEEGFRLIWVKLQNGWLHVQICISCTSKVLVSSKGSFHFVYRNFGQIWIKIIEWSIRVENCHFRTRFRLRCSILCVKRLLAYFGKIYRI